MPKLYWESVDLGDPVAPSTKPPVTRVQIAKFAGASMDYSPLHIDDDFAKSAGYGSVFAHGAISLGFATEAVTRWAENGRVLSSTATFQKLVWPGDILTAKGVVVQRYERHNEARIDVDVWAENQNHDIVMKGQVSVILWRNEKDEKKGKGIWPPVSAETISDRGTARPIPRSDAERAATPPAHGHGHAPAVHATDRQTQRRQPEPHRQPPASKPAAPAPQKPAAALAPAAPAKAPPAKAVPAKGVTKGAAAAKAAPPPAKSIPPPKAAPGKAPAAKSAAKPAPKAPAKAPPPKAPAKPAAKSPAKPAAKPAPRPAKKDKPKKKR